MTFRRLAAIAVASCIGCQAAPAPHPSPVASPPRPVVETPPPGALPKRTPFEWPGYPDDVEASLRDAQTVGGEALDGWLVGTLAPALAYWMDGAAERDVWIYVDGADDPCVVAIVSPPDADALPDDIGTEAYLQLKLNIEASADDDGAARTRSYDSGVVGHALTWGNGGGTDTWNGTAWEETSGYGRGEPAGMYGVLSRVDGDALYYADGSSDAFLECDSPQWLRCDGGGSRQCHDCSHLRLGPAPTMGAGTGPRTAGTDPCPDVKEPTGLRAAVDVVDTYGLRPVLAPDARPSAAVFNDRDRCVERTQPWLDVG